MWIIGDGGSPERAPSDTLESCSLAVSEWADGVLVRLWATVDGEILLAPRPVLPAVGGNIDLEKSGAEDRASRPVLSPLTGATYRLSTFPEFLQFLSRTPVRGFLEPSEKLFTTSALEPFREALLASRTRLPLHILLPPEIPPLALGSSVSFWRRASGTVSAAETKSVSLILNSRFLPDTPPPDLPRFLLEDDLTDDQWWSRYSRLPGFWGVVTRTPYFTRKRFDRKGPAA